jgi:prepilin-type N-terminal cleavage/methylation domain-containing protein
MRSRGFTLIELIVVVCVVALLFGVALDRLLRYQELGERAALEQNIAAMNTALTMKFAGYVISGKPAAIEAEVGSNPIDLLARPPENYLGELVDPERKALPPRSWYFDRGSGELVYLPGRSRYLTITSASHDGLRFRISLTEAREARELRQPFVGPSVPFTWQIE